MEYNKIALACLKELALDHFADYYDPEQDEPIWTSTITEICDHIYEVGINNGGAVLYRGSMLYVPKALRYQGKDVLKAHVCQGVLMALIEWKGDNNDLDFLEDGEEGAGRRI